MKLDGFLGWLIGSILAVAIVFIFQPSVFASILIGFILSFGGWMLGTIISMEHK